MITLRRTSGLTLVELLTVIAIICVLLAITFGAYQQAKISAYKTSDLANLKSIALAAHSYSADYADHLAFGSNESSKQSLLHGLNHQLSKQITEAPTIVKLLQPGIQSKFVWKSSQDCFQTPKTGDWDCTKTFFEEYGSSYYYDENNGLRSRTYSELNSASTCVAFGDTEPFRGRGQQIADAQLCVAYHDGHAKSVPWSIGTESYCDWLGFSGGYK